MAKSANFESLHLPPIIQKLAEEVHHRGGQAWLVGGGVRDFLMNQAVKDFDVEVFGLEPEPLEGLLKSLGHVNTVGKAFGVFKLRPHAQPSSEEIDVSIPRRDSNKGPGHKGIDVQGDPHMSVEEAVTRRDLTINAMMVDIRTRTLTDPANGYCDLQTGRLRAVDTTTFLEDPLRALRVIQFAARTGFQADPTLKDLCRFASLSELPAERIQAEWGKLLLRGSYIHKALQLAREVALGRVFPERVDDPSLDIALQRALSPRDSLTTASAQWILMLTVWLAHTSPEHAETTLDRLWIHRVGKVDVRRQVLQQLHHLQDPTDSDAALRHLSVHAELWTALQVRHAIHPTPHWSKQLTRARVLGIEHQKPTPLLQGRDLKECGIRPGPAMGTALRKVYTAQLDGLLSSRTEAISWLRENG